MGSQDRAVLVLTCGGRLQTSQPRPPSTALWVVDRFGEICAAESPLWVNASTIRNGYGHLVYLTGVMARRFTLRLPRRVVVSVAVILVLACVAAGIVAVRSGWFHEKPLSANEGATSVAVGPDGFDVTLSGVHLRGPAGLAPVGTVLAATSTTSSPPELPTAITANLGAGVDISLQGRQPDKPLELRFPVVGTPPEGQHAVLVTVPSDGSGAHLVPASFDAGTGTITATTTHLSLFWPAFIDLREVGRTFDKFVSQTLGITSPRPDCAGEKVADLSGTTISLVGDYSPTAKPAAWPCVSTKDGQVVVELTSNSPLPWRTRAAPAATLDPEPLEKSSLHVMRVFVLVDEASKDGSISS